MVNKKHGKQTRKKVWYLQKALSLITIEVCRFEIKDGVKYFYYTSEEFLLYGPLRVGS